jgi:thiamine biosynthesis lipoprotein
MMRFRSVLLFVALLAPAMAVADWFSTKADIMGTEIAVEVWHENTGQATAGAKAVLDEMQRINRLMSPYLEESELATVNRYAATRPVRIGGELYGLIQRSLEVSELTHGAFDITFSSVGYLYDYRTGKHPDAESIQSALPAINYHLIKLDPERMTILFEREGVRIDLGGIAKGYAVDNAIDILRDMGIEHARVTAGGDTRVLGSKRGRPWTVGIRHPREEGKVVAVLPILDESISTSGDYERYFDENGVRYHHILDPKTGDSARAVRSVTVIGPYAVMTDALSTSLFVLGVERGLELIDQMSIYEAILVDQQGELHFSNGLKQLQSATPPPQSAQPVTAPATDSNRLH